MMKYPNTFDEWIKTPSGRSCISWDSCLSNAKDAAPFLYNRAWWAFQAGVKLAPEQMQKTFEWYEDFNKRLQAEAREARLELQRLKKQLRSEAPPTEKN